MNGNERVFAALNEVDSLSCDLETIINALGLFREQLDTAVDGMDTSTQEGAAIAGAMFAGNYHKYEAALEVIQKALDRYKADMDTALEGVFKARREEIGVKEVG